MKRRPFVAANLKMNFTGTEVRTLATAVVAGLETVAEVDVAICPPFPWLAAAREAIGGSAVLLGAQTLHPEPKGAFTGEVSGAMLRDAGCEVVIVGHSERRRLFGETDDVVRAKTRAALREGLRPILCVGETLPEREKGDTIRVVDRQVDAALRGLADDDLRKITIAYEPVWAIGTGLTPTAGEVSEVHSFLRGIVREMSRAAGDGMRIQYGGSVTAENAALLLGAADVDGALVGGASLRAETFLPIVRAAAEAARLP